jgi:lysophospholipase L1-like esterase
LGLVGLWLAGAGEVQAQARVLCFGDSITAGYQVAIPYPTRLAANTGHSTINAGVGGETASGGLRRIDNLLMWSSPSHVLILFGTNDINQPNPNLQRSAEVVMEIALRVRAAGAIPIVGTVPPMIGRRAHQNSRVYSLNRHLRSQAAAQGIRVADINAAFGSGSGLMQGDGFHPNDEGQEVIARVFAEQITELLRLTPDVLRVEDTGVAGQAIGVTALGAWTAATGDPWITLVAGTAGTGNGTLTLNVAANAGAARTGAVTVTAGNLAQTLVVSQQMAQLRVRPETICLPSAGTARRTAAVSAHLPWTVTSGRPGWITITSGQNGAGNGRFTFSVAPNAGAARAGYIRVSVGDVTQTLRVNQYAAPVLPGVSAEADFDGDGRAELATYQPRTGLWTVRYATGVRHVFKWYGDSLKTPVPADYDGDGQVDFAVYHARSANWYILRSSDGVTERRYLGRPRAVPVPGDYDGDGRADLAVFHPSYGRWYIRGTTAGSYTAQWGLAGWVPVPADYDGDGVTDLAAYNPADGQWSVLRSANGRALTRRLGSRRYLPVPADYDGDGKADVAVYHHALGYWRIRQSSDNQLVRGQLGGGAVLPVPGDYDGDGRADLAVFDPATRTWQILYSASGLLTTQRLGGPNEIPVLAWPMIHDWLGLR